ncbi:MAG: rod shape-determining protein [Bacteroidales bacterium]|jgi:rod shape-determining protein MreB|nr:rod shape-determining protein [Bacteroidales bacterium]
MGLFCFQQELAIDLGTTNTRIIYKDRVVVNEPTIVSINTMTGKMIAIGEKARQMLGKTHENITTIKPLRDGVIANFDAVQQMIQRMVKIINKGNLLFTLSLKIVITIPSGCTEVERRAVRNLAEHAGGRNVYMIYESMAAAIGIGIDVNAPDGTMVVDIGGGTTEIAVIALGGIVCNQSLRVAGDDFTSDIQAYMRHQHNIKIGEGTAEKIKIGVGSALCELANPPPDFNVMGSNIITATAIEIPVSYQEIAKCLDKSISKIETAIFSVIENTPPELYADIVQRGIYLVGGSALLRGLDQRFTEKINMPFHVAEDPLLAVVRGTGIALKNVDKFSFLMR